MNNTLIIKELQLSKIHPSPMNPRKTFDETKLKEMSESIKAKGLIAPIVVRPRRSKLARNERQQAVVTALGIDECDFELIAGERRFRASKMAGLHKIPAIIRELDDEATAEIQAIENVQREDLHPLEEAAGYKMLIDRFGWTADTIAAKLNKSKGYIYGLLKLNQLPAAAAKALRDSRITKSIAELVARIPSQTGREEAAKAVASWRDPTFQNVKDWIQRTMMIELKGSPFPLELAIPTGEPDKLMPACNNCPKMTGNNRMEFPDGRADVCTDPTCHAAKVKTWIVYDLKKHQDKGDAVATSKQLDDIYQHGYFNESKWTDLAEQCWKDSKRRSYKKLLEGSELKPIYAISPKGESKYVVARKDAEAWLKKKHKIGMSYYESDSYKRSIRREKQRREKENKAQGQALTKITAAAEKMTFTQEFAKATAHALLWESDTADIIAKRMGLTVDQLANKVEKMESKQLAGLFAEIIFHERMDYHGIKSPAIVAYAKALKVKL